MNPAPISQNRYPGIKAFEPHERNIFFGREQEVSQLYAQVKAKPLVVLFSKSGIGKSSLINAGLVPVLDRDLFRAVKVRLQNVAESPVQTVKKELEKSLNEEKLHKYTGQSKEEVRLWEYLRACEFGSDQEQDTPVIIFDQFEEFFEHDRAQRQQLIDELSDLLSERLPDRIRQSLRKIPFGDRTPEDLAWHSEVNIKILFAIRADRLSLLDDLKKEIPLILHNRFHLRPLNRQQAEDAILKPAGIPGEQFSTPTFTYNPSTLERILDYLSNKDGEIESFQLQLLCQHIEKQVKERRNE